MPKYSRGIDAKAYVNTGTWATPVWAELTVVRDLTQTLNIEEFDITDRGSDFRKSLMTLLASEVSFDVPWNKTDAVLEDIIDAWKARSTVEMAFMDEAIATTGAEGLHAHMGVFGFTRRENRAEGQIVEITMKPSDGDDDPEWLVSS